MKKIITICLLSAGIYACNNGAPETKTAATTDAKMETKETATAKADPTDSPEFQKGLDLMNNSDCKTCHKVDDDTAVTIF